MGLSQTMTRRGLLSALPALAAAPSIRLPQRIRVAILGLDGHTGEIVRPLPQLPDVEVVAISDATPGAVEKFGKGNARLTAARRYTDYRRMLEQEKLDVVAVCNNNGERAQAILDCVDRNLHVIAEKPLALTREDLERIRRAVQQRRVGLGMLLPMRYDPQFQALKQLVDSGELGEIAQISAQKSYKAGQRPEWMRKRATYGGTIPWIGIHMVDLMRFTSGREFTHAASFAGHVGQPEIGDMENTTGTVFRMDNGGVATLHMDYYRPETAPTHGDDRLRLAGTKGVAEYMAATGVTVISANAKPRVVTELPPQGSVFVDFLEHVYNKKAPTLTLADIYRNNEIVIGAQEAAERNQIVRL